MSKKTEKPSKEFVEQSAELAPDIDTSRPGQVTTAIGSLAASGLETKPSRSAKSLPNRSDC